MKRWLFILALLPGLFLAAPVSAHSRGDVFVEVYPSSYWSFGLRYPIGYDHYYHDNGWHYGAPWCAHHGVYHYHEHYYRHHNRHHHRHHDWRHDDD